MTAIDPGLDDIAHAQRILFADNDLTLDDVARTIAGLSQGSDLADVYFERTEEESWSLRDGKVSQGGSGLRQGVGLRSAVGAETAFTYSGALSAKALRLTADAVKSMRRMGQSRAVDVTPFVSQLRGRPTLFPGANPLDRTAAAARIATLRDVDRITRAMDPRIVTVEAWLQMSHQTVLVATSDGRLAADRRPMTKMGISVIAEGGGRRAVGNATIAGRFGLERIDEARVRTATGDAVRIALLGLESRPAPAGVMSVVLGPGFPGLLLHEAVGHSLEGDAHRKRSSVFTDRMGGIVAAPGVTVIDDGSLPDRLGSLNIDDEGEATRETVLIRDGRLTGLMQDRFNAGLMNQRTTGNARRQSYAHLPMPRMTNTYLAAGQDDPADIIRSVKNGLYAVSFGGGTVDITSGQFNFSATEAYLIEDGRITAPVDGATLIGMGLEALRHIAMVGHDMKLENGSCGKAGQMVPVCVGQPTVRIDEMVVGGGG